MILFIYFFKQIDINITINFNINSLKEKFRDKFHTIQWYISDYNIIPFSDRCMLDDTIQGCVSDDTIKCYMFGDTTHEYLSYDTI